jgi:hypothetical protein
MFVLYPRNIERTDGGLLGKVDEPSADRGSVVYYLVADQGIARSFGAGGGYSGFEVKEHSAAQVEIK